MAAAGARFLPNNFLADEAAGMSFGGGNGGGSSCRLLIQLPHTHRHVQRAAQRWPMHLGARCMGRREEERRQKFESLCY